MRRTSSLLALMSIPAFLLCSIPHNAIAGPFDGMARFPLGARNVGMGGTGTADASADATGFFNPASIAWSGGLAAGWNRSQDSAEDTYNEFALWAGPGLKRLHGRNGWTFNGRIAYVRESIGQRVCPLEGCYTEGNDYYLAGTGAAGLRLGAVELAVGGAARYMETASALHDWSFDAGLIVALNIDRFEQVDLRPRIGASGKNMGEHMDAAGRFAVGLDVASSATSTRFIGRGVKPFRVSLDFDSIDDNEEGGQEGRWAFGGELSFYETLHIRLGVCDRAIPTFGDATTSGLGLSWIYRNVELRFDYTLLSGKLELYDSISDNADFFSLSLCSRSFPFALGD